MNAARGEEERTHVYAARRDAGRCRGYSAALLDALDQAEKIVNEARELTDCGETLVAVWALSEPDFDVAEKRWGNVRRLVAALAPDGGAGDGQP